MGQHRQRSRIYWLSLRYLYLIRISRAANLLWKVIGRLGLSYRSTKELNSIIDKDLPGRPSFACRDLTIGGETLHLYHRDILQCIRALYGNPEFTRDLIFAPERHFTDPERTCQVFSDMHTGEWWWEVQVRELLHSLIQLLTARNRLFLNHVGLELQ